MRDGTLLRFDTIVAICALLTSTVAAGAMVYQTHVIEEQFSAQVWPYLALDNGDGRDLMGMYLENQGVGPALLRSAQLSIDGRAVPDWNTAVQMLFAGVKRPHGTRLTLQFSTLDASTAVHPGESMRIAYIQSTTPSVIAALAAHHIALHICYCSINDRCWTLQSVEYGGGTPTPVGACMRHDRVGAHRIGPATFGAQR